MKSETLKELIEIAFKNSETMLQFKDNVFNLIDIYESDKDIPYAPTLPYMPNQTLPYIQVSGDKVPYHTICGCNPANGGNGICGCTMANNLITPSENGKNYYNSVTEILIDHK